MTWTPHEPVTTEPMPTGPLNTEPVTTEPEQMNQWQLSQTRWSTDNWTRTDEPVPTEPVTTEPGCPIRYSPTTPGWHKIESHSEGRTHFHVATALCLRLLFFLTAHRPAAFVYQHNTNTSIVFTFARDSTRLACISARINISPGAWTQIVLLRNLHDWLVQQSIFLAPAVSL